MDAAIPRQRSYRRRLGHGAGCVAISRFAGDTAVGRSIGGSTCSIPTVYLARSAAGFFWSRVLTLGRDGYSGEQY